MADRLAEKVGLASLRWSTQSRFREGRPTKADGCFPAKRLAHGLLHGNAGRGTCYANASAD